jgi:mRNA-degrading endonuclease RelE of RelBE toxin-antitoxin system
VVIWPKARLRHDAKPPFGGLEAVLAYLSRYTHREAGKRLVYEVEDETETLLVLTVGDRDGNDAYDVARTRA